ncbi:MAG: acyl-CoA dehydrogenase family protein [Myxococcota bacterium]|nr:acyl-CoA dehydrogenase family protein [Myxococcota bacterium]
MNTSIQIELGADFEAHFARAGRFADEQLAPEAAERDRHELFPRDTLKAIAGEGLFGINVSPDDGGLGAGVEAYARIVRRLAEGCAGTTVAMMVSNMVAEAVACFGSESQRARFLKPLLRGEWPAAGFCLSEPDSGSDAASMRATATRLEAGGYRLDGTKAWITSGGEAGFYLITAKTDPSARARGVSAFLVAANTPGLSASKPEEKMGLHSSLTTQIHLERCEVGADALLGEEGQGFSVMMNALDGGRIGVSAQAIGIADAALALLRSRYLRDGGNELATLLAQSQSERDAAWALCLRAAKSKDAGRPLTREASISKLYCTETAGRICRRTLQGLRGEGAEAQAAARLLRDVRVTRIYEGTSEVQRLVIARNLISGR